MLADTAIRGAKDDLLGLEENIIIEHLLPAGSGIYRYAEIDIEPPEGYEPPPPVPVEAEALPVAPLAPVPELDVVQTATAYDANRMER